MITKQILISAFLLNAISTMGLAMEQDQKIRRFDKGWDTRLNDACCNLFKSIVLKWSWSCNEDNDVKIIKIIDNKKIQQGTVESFTQTYHHSLSDLDKKVIIIQFWNNVNDNNALFDPNNKTIFYGSKTDIDNYHNKIKLLDKKLEQKKSQLQWNKKFVNRYCKADQCKNLKAEIEKTEKEINQLYQNL